MAPAGTRRSVSTMSDFPRRATFSKKLDPSATFAIQGDVTRLWLDVFRDKAQAGEMVIYGVSTETAYFCLATLMQDLWPADVSSQVVTREGELCIWSLTNTNKVGVV